MFNVIELRKVIKAVENAPPEHFDMRTWQCGTAACAIGHYCLANPDGQLYLKNGVVYRRNATRYGMNDLETAFNITNNEFDWLFYCGDHDAYTQEQLTDKQYVINRIKKFIVDKIVEYHQQLPKKIIARELV